MAPSSTVGVALSPCKPAHDRAVSGEAVLGLLLVSLAVVAGIDEMGAPHGVTRRELRQKEPKTWTEENQGEELLRTLNLPCATEELKRWLYSMAETGK
jgi:hypothetical protein